MAYQFLTCDVFTTTRFGGNPLAVLPHASGLSGRQMQQIAREFNFSETTFVFPAEAGHTRKVRIFTPSSEIPFAGHPNVGTAFVLASTGEFGQVHGTRTVTFEEGAGLVEVTVHEAHGQITSCELAAPQPVALGKVHPAAAVAAAVSLHADDIVTAHHPPRVASVGLPFLVVELRDRAALERAKVSLPALEAIAAGESWTGVHLYARTDDEFDLRTRMFAPLAGIVEDPATGSANCALAGLLAGLQPERDGMFRWRIAQGVEMGRPSTLEARAEKRDGAVTGTWIGGASVMVTEGSIHL